MNESGTAIRGRLVDFKLADEGILRFKDDSVLYACQVNRSRSNITHTHEIKPRCLFNAKTIQYSDPHKHIPINTRLDPRHLRSQLRQRRLHPRNLRYQPVTANAAPLAHTVPARGTPHDSDRPRAATPLAGFARSGERREGEAVEGADGGHRKLSYTTGSTATIIRFEADIRSIARVFSIDRTQWGKATLVKQSMTRNTQ